MNDLSPTGKATSICHGEAENNGQGRFAGVKLITSRTRARRYSAGVRFSTIAVATTRIRLNSARWVMARGIVTTLHARGQRTLRRPQPSHGRKHRGGLLLVDEVPCPRHALHNERRQRRGEDRNFLRGD